MKTGPFQTHFFSEYIEKTFETGNNKLKKSNTFCFGRFAVATTEFWCQKLKLTFWERK